MSAIDLSHIHGEPAPEQLALALEKIAGLLPDRAALVTAAGGTARRAAAHALLAAKVADVEAVQAAVAPVGAIVHAREADTLVAVAGFVRHAGQSGRP